MSLTKQELERYKRHIVLTEIGAEGQIKLKQASVLVVGTGGLGSPIAMYLAASGVGHIGLIDFDVVDVSNLQRQIIHKTSHVGEAKTWSAEKALKEINPHVKVSLFNCALNKGNAFDIIKQFDIVTDGTDNFATRYLVNDACVLSGKINVFGSIRQFEGQVSVFGTKDGPCYRCLFPEPPEAGSVPSCADAGVMGVLPGVIGTLQATEVIKLITGIGQALTGRLLNYDALAMSFNEIKFMKDPDCPCCGEHPTLTELIDYEIFCGDGGDVERKDEISASELKQLIEGGGALQLIDVREPEELLEGQIAGALNIPMQQIPERKHEIVRDMPVVIFCHLGMRSLHVIEYLKREGYDNLINLSGGIDAWEAV
ncbi:molybdopterin-synthase adenylyltransferase MoeB [Carboxylicivirga mesophila]|uniref:Molybdopterin-synthase adenylyltransferase MoeB n=1 Tax=Carboxylicivirga mesophila TaxID=1166478 RepID=A0ABS5KFW5_9BACT|nr:molybdopterin-synthase adenylyltransferase MoeB [Carboxylicivirga mesophila]MBS2213799.1 molybdopterin-synthase adenylyltransferase MoeB [Carboxylicivirga mesophila]